MATLFDTPENSAERKHFLGAFCANHYTGLSPVTIDGPAFYVPPTFDLCPPLTPYLVAYSAALSYLDAWFSGAIFKRMGAIVVNGRQIVPVLCPDGSCEFRTPQVYTARWFGPREQASAFMLKRIAVLSFGLFLIICGAWVALLLPVPTNPNKTFVLWLAAYMKMVGEETLNGEALFSGTFLMFMTVVFVWGLLVVLLTSKSSSSASLGLRSDDFPSVLRLLVHLDHPRLMVSYAWASAAACKAARSLAFALPDTWVDVKCLSSGSLISEVTRDVAVHAEALVIFLNAEYLKSEACMVEFGAAILARKAASQVTIVYFDPRCPVSSAAAAELTINGCRSFSTPVTLLQFLANHVYKSTTPEDTLRASRYVAQNSIPIREVPRLHRLPAPLTRTQSWLPSCGGRCCAPKGSLYTGAKFLTPGAEKISTAFVVSVELVMVLVIAACFVGLAASLALQPLVTEAPLFFAGAVLLYLLLAIPISRFIKTLAVDTDPRNYHSPLLFPLNAAAFCNEVVTSAKSSGLGSPVGEGGAPSSPTSRAPLSVRLILRDAEDPQLPPLADGEGSGECGWVRGTLRNTQRYGYCALTPPYAHSLLHFRAVCERAAIEYRRLPQPCAWVPLRGGYAAPWRAWLPGFLWRHSEPQRPFGHLRRPPRVRGGRCRVLASGCKRNSSACDSDPALASLCKRHGKRRCGKAEALHADHYGL